MQSAAEDIVKKLADIATKDRRDGDDTPCALCGRGTLRAESLQIQAGISLLDRSGFGPKSTVVIEDDEDRWLDFTTGEEAEQIHAIMERAIERMRTKDQPLEAGVH